MRRATPDDKLEVLALNDNVYGGRDYLPVFYDSFMSTSNIGPFSVLGIETYTMRRATPDDKLEVLALNDYVYGGRDYLPVFYDSFMSTSNIGPFSVLGMETYTMRRATPDDKLEVLALNDNVYGGRDYLPVFYDSFMSTSNIGPFSVLGMETYTMRRATPDDKLEVLALNDNVYGGRDYLPVFYDSFMSTSNIGPFSILGMETYTMRRATPDDKLEVLALNDNVYGGRDYLPVFYDSFMLTSNIGPFSILGMETYTMRRATPDDKLEVLALNDNVYGGRDYLPVFYDSFMSTSNIGPFALLLNGKIVRSLFVN